RLMGQMVELGAEHVRPGEVLARRAQSGLEPSRPDGARDLGAVGAWLSNDPPGRGCHGLGEGNQLLGHCCEVAGILLGASRALLGRISSLGLGGSEPKRLAGLPLGKSRLSLPALRDARSA